MAIDILESKVVGTNKETWYKLIGTKDDTKPTGEFPAGTGHTVAKDSTYFEMGTEIRYEFDGSTWNPKGQVPVTLIEKEITQNGVYSASDDDANGYSSVTANVPNTYTTDDEGKVVDNGALVAQTARAEIITANDTYDTTSNNSVTVNVEAGIDAEYIGYGNPPTFFSYFNSLKSIVIPVGYDAIADFKELKSLESVVIPEGVTAISSQCFSSCRALKTIVLPSTLTSISSNAFNLCSALPSIEIPASVTSIGGSAFSNCTSLTSIVIHKAEDSISGAPWGAPNATVTWTG